VGGEGGSKTGDSLGGREGSLTLGSIKDVKDSVLQKHVAGGSLVQREILNPLKQK